MTPKQKEQFNRMRSTLKRIAAGYDLCDPSGEVVVRGSDGDRQVLTQALKDLGELAAYSAQAQPPAASVPDGLVDALRHQRQMDEDGAEVGVSRQAVDEAANILAMLAAVPQPPAARVPDWTDAQCVAFMAVGLRHTEYKKGKSPTVEEIRQGAKAALAAQENPNG